MNAKNIVTLYQLDVEVAGELGTATEFLNEAMDELLPQRQVHRLEFVFSDWLGDEIVTSTPCYLITESLANELLESGITGISTVECMISAAENVSTDIRRKLESIFVRLMPAGRIHVLNRNLIPNRTRQSRWSGHDICLGPNSELVVSQKAMAIIGPSRVPNATIRPILSLAE